MKIALISGASGMVGKQLLYQLLKNQEYGFVLSVGRRILAMKHEKLIQIEGDMSRLKDWDWENQIRAQSLGGEYQSFLELMKNSDTEIHAYSSIGTTIKVAGSQEKFFEIDHDLVIGFAAWANRLGAKKFLYVSAMGADSTSSIFYNKVKGETEEDLKTFPFDYLGVFRPSLLLGNRHEFRLGEKVATILMKPMVWLRLFKNFRPIYDYQVAKSMVLKALESNSSRVEIISSGQMQDLSK